ncbi:transcription termination factor NusA [Candidatus Dependentiae bacterium]|nr:transcription termination factor NusA [Candidatus Dependentiae bacterium]
MNLLDVINELVEERGLDRSVLSAIVCEGILGAYQRKYPDVSLAVDYDKKSGEFQVRVTKTVVTAVENENREITLRKARNIDSSVQLGQEMQLPFDGSIGRVEILKAKQFIAQKIREIEAKAIYDALKPKEGTIVHGTVHKVERGGTLVTLPEGSAFLPRSLTIPDEKCIPGHPIRALLKEVLVEPRAENQLILDRVSPKFLELLFELEIPEIYEKIVEIKKIARAAGYKSKVVVASTDNNIDPVGTCVGIGGARIKPILKELGTEKIDIIEYSASREEFVAQCLKPAEINRVEIIDNARARVWLNEDQRSLAIGKMGKNITLASQLTGLEIELVSSGQAAHEPQLDFEQTEL